jgi:membrane protease YdiL (CAAX protease family)
MTIAPDEPVGPSAPAIAVAPASAWRLVGRGFLWSLLSCLGAIVVSAVAGLVLRVIGLYGRLGAEDLPGVYALFGVVGSATVLTWVALHNAPATGRGDWRAGVGDRAIERPWAVALIGAVLSTYAALITLSMLAASPRVLHRVIEANPVLIAFGLLLAVVAAPLAEELFFRGWLWTGLRAQWGAVGTAAASSALWLMLHLPDGVGRVTLLVPAAIALPLARHLGGSVRASILIHACNNAAVGAAPLIALWLGWLTLP